MKEFTERICQNHTIDTIARGPARKRGTFLLVSGGFLFCCPAGKIAWTGF